MRRRMLLLISAVIAVLAISVTIAVASGGSDERLTGPDAERAIAVALEATGGGTANEVERDDEGGGAFEVEVTRPDGTTVDVRLDGAFEVIAIEGEGTDSAEGAEDADDADDTEDADGSERDDTDDTREPEADDGEG